MQLINCFLYIVHFLGGIIIPLKKKKKQKKNKDFYFPIHYIY